MKDSDKVFQPKETMDLLKELSARFIPPENQELEFGRYGSGFADSHNDFDEIYRV